jgi:hypothetical protein
VPGRFVKRSVARLPGLRRLPVLKLLAIAEIALLVRDHLGRLTPEERRRLVQLARKARARPSNLSADERRELQELVAKAEPRRFAGLAADKLSPFKLPRRIVEGPRQTR